MWMEREANLSELKSYELLWINLSSGKTELGHFWPRCLYSSDCRHWYLTESGLELQLSSGSDSLGDCGIQHHKTPNGCKAISLEKWDFTVSGSDWLIPPQMSVILLWSVSKFALCFNYSSFKYAWVVRPAGYSSAKMFFGWSKARREDEKYLSKNNKSPQIHFIFAKLLMLKKTMIGRCQCLGCETSMGKGFQTLFETTGAFSPFDLSFHHFMME